MMFKTHVVASMVATTALMPTINNINLISSSIPDVGFLFGGAFIGATLPDLDSPNSKIRRLIRKVLTGNPTPQKNIINHRRVPHMPLIWVAIFGAMICGTKMFLGGNPMIMSLIYGLIIGVFSHLFIDMFNPTGIPLYGPFYRKKVSIFFIKSNSMGETIFLLGLVAIEVYLIFGRNIPIFSL